MIESIDVKTGVAKAPDQGLLALLIQTNKAIHKRSTEELIGMRLKAYMTLGHIRDHPGATQQELEKALVMDANSVVLILNELEAKGFSIRRRDPQDRRRHILEMTAAGTRALEKADKQRESLEAEMLADVSAEERKTLKRLLERVLENLLQPVA